MLKRAISPQIDINSMKSQLKLHQIIFFTCGTEADYNMYMEIQRTKNSQYFLGKKKV